MKKYLSFVLIFSVIFTMGAGNVYVRAASLAKTSVTVSYGKKKTVAIKGTKIKNVSSKNKKIATAVKKSAKKLSVSGGNEGQTKVIVKGTNGKTYTLKVTVKAVLKESSLNVNFGKRVTAVVQGGTVKSAKWKSGSRMSEVTQIAKKKVVITATGSYAGTDKFIITTKKGTKLTLTVKVRSNGENPSAGNPPGDDPSGNGSGGRGGNSAASFGTGMITSALSYEFPSTAYAKEKECTSFLTSGQASDVTLLSYDTGKADAYHLYHPNGIAYYYDDINLMQYYFVADTWNNRVLIFRCKKTECLNESIPVYAVLGQSSTETSYSGASLSNLNFPINVAVADLDTAAYSSAKIYVTDTNNSRVLVWDSIPASNGKAADFQLCYTSSSRSNSTMINWPWGIYTDGKKLITVSTRAGEILVWNELPNGSSDYPDCIIKTGGTPRNISFDAKGNALIPDHNVGSAAGESGSDMGTRVIKKANFDKLLQTSGQTTYQYDYFLASGTGQTPGLGQVGTCLLSGGISSLSGSLLAFSGWDGLLHVYKDGVIDSAADMGDYTIWSSERDTDSGFYSWSGDVNSVIQDVNGNVYAVSYNGNKVMGYSAGAFPKSSADSGNLPDLSFGVKSKDGSKALSVNANVTDEMDMLQNCRMDILNDYLVACDDFNETFAIYRGIPDETGALPDVLVEYHQNGTDYNTAAQDFNDVCLYDSGNGKTGFIVGGSCGLNIWYDIENVFDKKEPDLTYRKKLGSLDYNSLRPETFDYDGNYLYIASNDKIYIFKGFPEDGQSPAAEISTGNHMLASRISVDRSGSKTYLVDCCGYTSNPVIYDVTDVSSVTRIGTVSGAHDDFWNFNGCFHAQVTGDGHFIAADSGNAHIDIWNSISDAVSGKAPQTVIGLGTDFYSARDIDPERTDTDPVNYTSPTTLNYTYFVKYDEKGYLWTSSFKFSGGIRRFPGRLN